MKMLMSCENSSGIRVHLSTPLDHIPNEYSDTGKFVFFRVASNNEHGHDVNL